MKPTIEEKKQLITQQPFYCQDWDGMISLTDEDVKDMGVDDINHLYSEWEYWISFMMSH